MLPGGCNMACRVVLVMPLRSSLGLSGTHDELFVADIRHPDAVEAMLATVHRNGEFPIVTCTEDDYDEVCLQVLHTSIRYPGFRACVEPIHGTPTAVSVISSLVEDLDDGDNTLAWRLSALDYLRRNTWSAVWLPKVTDLSHPAPSMIQHIKSWLPGSGFLVVKSPDPVVMSASKAPLTGLGPRPGWALLHSPVTQAAWVVDAAMRALSTDSVSEVAVIREPVDAYGTAAAIELIAVPVSFSADSRPDPAAIRACPACGLRHARSTCPSCKMTVSSEPVETSQGVPS